MLLEIMYQAHTTHNLVASKLYVETLTNSVVKSPKSGELYVSYRLMYAMPLCYSPAGNAQLHAACIVGPTLACTV